MSDDRASAGIVLFGGTFDPPHLGHLVVAQDAFDTLPVRRVAWIPCGHPPHKPAWRLTSPELRLEMTRAAVAEDERFVVSDVEVRRKGMSFTVDTIREVVAAEPGVTPFLLIGPDQAAAFRSWREPEEIARLARVVVMVPGGSAFGRVPSPGVTHDVLPVTRVDVSSTEVRARFREGRRLRYLVPEAVRAVVEREGLYRHTGRQRIATAGVASRGAPGAGRRHITMRQSRWTDR
jgi:nicotinate-nucleotide adenylyltransferase